jgi:hypothetical protein
MNLSLVIQIAQLLAIVFGGGFALYQFKRSQDFKRLQNLSGIWKQFTATKELLELFELCNDGALENDKAIEELQSFSKQVKLKYLALIEEVALYVEQSEVEKKYAINLFQWHFKFAFKEGKVTEAFWKNLGGIEEMNA